MTTDEVIQYLHKLYTKSNFTDECGDMGDTDSYEEAMDAAIDALAKWITKEDNAG